MGASNIQKIFTRIYDNNTWGTDGTSKFFSGGGSRGIAAEKYISLISNFIKSNNIKNIVDIGSGDFYIGKQILDDVSINSYIGIDIVEDIIDYSNREFGTDQILFKCEDVVKTKELPDGDLCLIRQVLQHLDNTSISIILEKIKKFKYVIVTEHQPPFTNHYNLIHQTSQDIRLKWGSGVFLDKPPFNLNVKEILSIPVDDGNISYIKTFLIKN